VRVESKSCVEEEILAKGAIIFFHDVFKSAVGISPWRARISHSPMLAWKAPRVFPRSASFEILSIEPATVTKFVADSSLKPGNSEKTRYQLLNCEYLLANRLTVWGERRFSGERPLSSSHMVR